MDLLNGFLELFVKLRLSAACYDHFQRLLFLRVTKGFVGFEEVFHGKMMGD
jgi:hypothetical protein